MLVLEDGTTVDESQEIVASRGARGKSGASCRSTRRLSGGLA